MLGRATARLHAPPRRWLRHIYGIADIHDRQKWSAVWPQLALLPERDVRLLDAGCGDGSWSLELAARRPEWQIVGIDHDRGAIETAERNRRRLALDNVSFVESDFLDYRATGSFQAVLSVASAHYLAAHGKGVELFARFHEWLQPGGCLVFLGPRRAGDAWFAPWLFRPHGHSVFTAEELTSLCRQSALRVELLAGRIGRLGTLAKQLQWEAHSRSRILGRLLHPLSWILSALDSRLRQRDDRRTMTLLLVARAVKPE